MMAALSEPRGSRCVGFLHGCTLLRFPARRPDSIESPTTASYLLSTKIGTLSHPPWYRLLRVSCRSRQNHLLETQNQTAASNEE